MWRAVLRTADVANYRTRGHSGAPNTKAHKRIEGRRRMRTTPRFEGRLRASLLVRRAIFILASSAALVSVALSTAHSMRFESETATVFGAREQNRSPHCTTRISQESPVEDHNVRQ
jgi:hypothetical protein